MALDERGDNQAAQRPQIGRVGGIALPEFLLKQPEVVLQRPGDRENMVDFLTGKALFRQTALKKDRIDHDAAIGDVAQLHCLRMAAAALQRVDAANPPEVDLVALHDLRGGGQGQEKFIGRVAVRKGTHALFLRAAQHGDGQKITVIVVAQLGKIAAVRVMGVKKRLQLSHDVHSSGTGIRPLALDALVKVMMEEHGAEGGFLKPA